MNELRQDMVSGEWVIMATERSKRPHDFSIKKPRERSDINTCPFEYLSESGNSPIALFPWRASEKNWKIAVVPNKFPILNNDPKCPVIQKKGIYTVMEGKGHHELLITRDHDKDFPELTPLQSLELLMVAKSRYKVFDNDPCIAYVSLFHLWGPRAGASVYHPHYQMIGLPVLPPDIDRSVKGAKHFFKEHGECAHCSIIQNEKEYGKRIVFENEFAIALAPFASRQPFEVRIFPKKHEHSFSGGSEKSIQGVSGALREVISRMKKRMGDPDYNFFLHSSPVGEGDYSFYHWHIEVIPQTSVFGGLEWETGMIVNVVDPEAAADILKK